MSGHFDAPDPHFDVHTPSPDPFAGARSDVWSPPPASEHGEYNPGWGASLTRPEAIAGETLVGGGILSRLLLASKIDPRLSLAAVIIGAGLTAYSLMEQNPKK